MLSNSSDLELLYADARERAKLSPCVRRKYGAVIAIEDENGLISHVHGHNLRIGRCCDGNICARDRWGLRNGERTELGAEIHAEQVALIDYHPPANLTRARFILACLDHTNKEVYGPKTFPCHTCALMIQYAGFGSVYTMLEPGLLEPINIWDIIEHREKEWEWRYDV